MKSDECKGDQVNPKETPPATNPPSNEIKKPPPPTFCSPA